VLDRVLQKYDALKINTVFNDEFVADDKRANKNISTRNCEFFRLFNLREWYELHVIELTLASLEEFQDVGRGQAATVPTRYHGWVLSRILNLTVNINKYNPLHAGCYIELSREIMMKRAVANVRSIDNACFAWSVVAALHPVEKNSERQYSYPDYASVLNLKDIKFPMTLNQIKAFENFNDISINVSINIHYREEEKRTLDSSDTTLR